MKIGSYGNVIFQVSSEVAETFRNLQHSSTASYVEHSVHGGNAVREFTGFPSDKISFSILMSAFQGVNPDAEVKKLMQMMKSKKAYSLVIGQSLYGEWTLESVSNSIQHTWKDGTCIQCETDLTLCGRTNV